MKKVLGIFIVILMFASCGTNSKNSKNSDSTDKKDVPVDIIGKYTILKLDSLNLNDYDFGNKIPLIAFDNEKKTYSTNIGCNQISGKYEIDRSDIKMYLGVSTMMACPDDLEKRYIKALSEVDNFIIEDFQLKLYKNEDLRIVLLPTKR
ncbi:MAG: META domain-containing protein [Bacteroidota bacterium]